MRKLVATVTPHYKPVLTADDEVSLRHLRHFLGSYDNIIIAPEGLAVNLPDFEIRRFAQRDFSSVKSYSRLLLSKRFYEAFEDYDYILIYQLDCLVFSSGLLEWCGAGWDYIGAPWLANEKEKFTEKGDLWAVGNGGLSLRRVSSFLRVFDSKVRPYRWNRVRPVLTGWRRSPARSAARLVKHWARCAFSNNIGSYLSRYTGNEDGFWGLEANRFDSGFRVPPVEVALPFSMEYNPRFCYARNGGQLPFGCHAWAKHDRAFWQQFILPCDTI